jgi:hypothetical protein
MRIVPIRKGSKGLQGTYDNANHHAPKLVPLIEILESMIKYHGRMGYIEIWEQGHNIHIITRADGFRLYFRPCRTKVEGEVDAIMVGYKHSREVEIPLFCLDSTESTYQFGASLCRMFNLPENYYGVSTPQDNNNNHEKEQ